jgi:hypothetical protein
MLPVNITGGSTLIGPNQNTTWTLTDTNAGSISGFPNGLTFSSIQNLRGGNANDTFTLNGGSVATINGGRGSNTLIGDNTVNTWNITGVNAGNVNGTTSFTAIGNFTGGNLDDSFQFNRGASLSGNLDGGLAISL